jgi:hypothetical protein
MNPALEQLDLTRQKASQTIAPKTKSELGQYMTPSRIADFMASSIIMREFSRLF